MWPPGCRVIGDSAIRALPNNTVVNLYSRTVVVNGIHSHDSLVVKSRVLNHLSIVHSSVHFARQTRISLHVKVIKSRRGEV